MPIPATIRVKISSEAAEAIALTPVVVREMTPSELMAVIVAFCGKDRERIREFFVRGSVTSGSSRYRWERLEPAWPEIEALLAEYPDPEPGRPFDARCCLKAVFHARAARIEVTREAGGRKGWFQKASFWDCVLELARGAEYSAYSYRERADVYRARISAETLDRVRQAAPLVKYGTLAAQLATAAFEKVDFFVERP